jgi:hypothetical protein
MKRLALVLALVSALIGGGFVVTSAQGVTVEQKRAFGTIAKGSTVCIGPMGRTDGAGIQLFGFTNGATSLTWQLRTVSSQGPPVVIFQTTALSVDHVDTTTVAGLFDACVIKSTGNTPQDFDITLNSPPTE